MPEEQVDIFFCLIDKIWMENNTKKKILGTLIKKGLSAINTLGHFSIILYKTDFSSTL